MWTPQHDVNGIREQFGDIFGANLSEYENLLKEFCTTVGKKPFSFKNYDGCHVVYGIK